jgi:DNA polymerase elongation subunit (family B)
VKRLQLTPAKLTLGSPQHTLVLEVVPNSLNALHPLADLIDSWGGFHRYQLFNVDLRLPTRYLHERNVFCHAQVTWDNKRFTCKDDQWALDYQVPSFMIMHLDAAGKKKGVPSFQEPLPAIRIDDEIIQEDNETDTILSLLDRIKQIDPDVITTVNGDSLLFPLLYHRAKTCGIEHLMNLSKIIFQLRTNRVSTRVLHAAGTDPSGYCAIVLLRGKRASWHS